MPPPSSGGIHLVQILNMMEGWPMSDWGAGSAQAIHHMAEAMKLAYADRSEYLGDTDFVKVPVAGLTSKAYARKLAATIDATHARPSSQIHPGKPQPYESDQTTHYSAGRLGVASPDALPAEQPGHPGLTPRMPAGLQYPSVRPSGLRGSDAPCSSPSRT